jgi:nitrite reductase/ring-hydroxylating ferredoxin subunit
MREIDTERVLCRLDELAEHGGTRGFALGEGDWPLRGFVVAVRPGVVRAFVNRCPHAGHPLNLRPHRFLTPDRSLIVCASHGALFDRDAGLCIAGPCAGRALTPLPVEIVDGYVLLDPDVDLSARTEDASR